MRRSVLSRFVEKVDFPDDRASGCWAWCGAVKGGRYPEMRAANGERMGAHVLAFMLAYGELPYGYDVHHACGNTLCVNPEHLVAMTRSEHKTEHSPLGDDAYSERAYYERLTGALGEDAHGDG